MPLLLIQGHVPNLIQHENLAVDSDADKPRTTGGFEDIFVFALLAANLGRHQRYTAALFQIHDGINYLGNGLPFNRQAALGTMGHANPGKQQAQIVVNLRHRAYSGTGIVGDALLVDGDSRRKTLDIVNVGLIHPAQKLPGVGG